MERRLSFSLRGTSSEKDTPLCIGHRNDEILITGQRVRFKQEGVDPPGRRLYALI